MYYTTFALAKQKGTCIVSYREFAKHVGGIKRYGKDTLIPLTDILDVLGLNDALWCLRCTTENCDRMVRLFACDCAEHVLHIFEKEYPDDKRPRQAIETSRKYANGHATLEELEATVSAAWYAGWSATWSAAEYAAWSAAWSATVSAVGYAAWSVAMYTAWYAASDAARSAVVSAVGYAAWSVAMYAAGYAAEREWQSNKFREYMEAKK